MPPKVFCSFVFFLRTIIKSHVLRKMCRTGILFAFFDHCKSLVKEATENGAEFYLFYP